MNAENTTTQTDPVQPEPDLMDTLTALYNEMFDLEDQRPETEPELTAYSIKHRGLFLRIEKLENLLFPQG